MTGIAINTNVGALSAKAAVGSVNTAMETAMERLSSGKRINAAKDDAAGTSIALRLTSEIKSINQSIRNALDAQAMIDAAEGAQSEITTILIRMRELSIQAGNDTNNVQDRANLQLEIDQLTAEIDRISEVTTWAGVDLLNGRGGVDGNGTLRFQVGSGTNSEDMITTQINSVSASALGVGTPDPSTAVSAAAGVTSGASKVTVDEDTAVASVEFAGRAFSSGVASISASGLTMTRGTGGEYIFDAGAAAAGTAISITLNGKTYSEIIEDGDDGNPTGTFDNGDRAGSVSKLMAAIALDYPWATAGAGDGSVATDASFTVSRSGLATDLAAKLNADGAFSARFLAAASGNDVNLSAKLLSPSVSVGTNTAVSNGTAAISVSNGVLDYTVDGSASGTQYNKISISIDNETFVFDTKLDGVDKGYAMTTAAGFGNALSQKIKDSGFPNLTFSIDTTNGTLTITKSGAIDISSAANAQASVNLVDAAIAQVNEQRAKLGAISNRLEMTVSNLTNIVTNLQTGRGRIEDADFAAESTELAKTQILQQASMAMLSQANASKQSVMNLLQGR